MKKDVPIWEKSNFTLEEASADNETEINVLRELILCMKDGVPIWEKSNLTLEEASAYSGVGINKLREISNEKNCSFVLWNGSKRLIKRKLLDAYLEKAFSI